MVLWSAPKFAVKAWLEKERTIRVWVRNFLTRPEMYGLENVPRKYYKAIARGKFYEMKRLRRFPNPKTP